MAGPQADEGQNKRVSRRAFPLAAIGSALKNVTALRLGWVAFVASCTAASAASFRFLFPNVLFEPPSTVKVGYPSEYGEVGTVYTQWKQKWGFWLVRNAEGIYALSTACTHLGCTPNWLAMEQKFKCPCHGSGFHRSGINFEGPAPRPLERFRIVLADDGQILVDKSKKYQQERGEWEETESFLEV